MALILNIETSTKSTSVAIAEDDKLLACVEEHNVISHASKLTPFIKQVSKEAQKDLFDLDAIAVSIGPGSYTGLRIGLSTAKGLCYALNIPLISVSGLEAMLLKMKNKYTNNNKFYVSAMNSRANEVYCAYLDNETGNIVESQTVVLNKKFLQHKENEEIVIAGTGLEKIKKILENKKTTYDENILFSAKNMIETSFTKFKQNLCEDLAYCEPKYLKPFMTT